MTETKNICLQLTVKTDAREDAEGVAWELTDWFIDAIEQHQEGRKDCCDWELIDLKPFNEEEEN